MDSDRGKLFVGGISWETTEGMLKDYFKAYGEVVEAVIMRDKVTGRARGFGFVVFADPAVADRVQQEKHTIDGRVVEAKAAVPRGEQQNFARSNSTNPMSGGQIRTKKIFVGGLASTVTEEEFKRYFEQFGHITDVVVMYDHNTQRPRGFGFITFDSEDAVDKVLQKSFHELNDKMVEVKRAVPRELSSGPIGRSSASGFGPGAGRGAPFGSYGQAYNPNPGNAYGSHVDSLYGPPAPAPAGRGSYPAYGPGGYGAGGGYGGDMNGGYGAGSYGGGAMYGTAGAYGTTGYGSAPTGTNYGGASGYGSGVPSVGYGSAPVGPRSPWGSTGTGFASGGSPVGYGATGGAGMAGYGSAGWGSGATGQPTGGSTGGYGGVGYGSVAGGGTTAYGATGYGDVYSSSGYADPTWRSGADTHSSPASGSVPLATGGYVLDSGAAPDGTINGPSNYGGGYGAAGRQPQRSSDTRFRPYPATGERTV